MKNIVLANWKAAAGGFFHHPELEKEIPDALRRNVSKEFKNYSKYDSVLKETESDVLVSFSNKILAYEIEQQCPLWNATVSGACGVDKSSEAANPIALATSAVARKRNATMSAVAYRISAILIHSGVKFVDVKRLNHLSVCMSPDQTVLLQKKI